MPENLRQDIGYFNVFRLDDYVGPKAGKLPYSRKDFHKITLALGNSNYHFADKTVELRGQLTTEANPPLHLLLGQDAYQRATNKLDVLRQNFENWQALTVSTGFEA